MSRDIHPIPSSASGDDIYVPFPDLAKPEDGNWDLNVTLYDDVGSARATIRLLQEDSQINSLELGKKTVLLTTSPATHNIPITGGKVSQLADGRCHLSRLFLSIVRTPCHCCCDDAIPSTLTATLTVPDCPTLDGLTLTMNYDPVGPKYLGEKTLPNGVIVRVAQADALNNGVPYCPIVMNYFDPNDPACNAGTITSTSQFECGPPFYNRLTTDLSFLSCLDCGPATSGEITIEITP